MNVTAITTACHRPEAWKLCEDYVARQTIQPVQWLVLDDDEIPTTCTKGQEYHYWPEMRGRGSLAKKIKRALADNLIKSDALVFVENDDYYAPDYIEWSIAGLSHWQLYGEGRAVYYNVHRRFWFEHTNLKHASLCATSLTRALFPWLLKQCSISDEPFLDVRLWNRAPLSAHVEDPYKDGSRKHRSVGIKAMPGRTGYGGGHRGRDKSAVADPHLAKLRSLIGDDAELYAKFYEEDLTPLPPEQNAYIAPPRKMHTPISRSEAGRVHGANWMKWLGHLRGEKAVGLEIGTFEGDSAEWMLENIFTDPDSRYHCVDPFTGSIEHKIGNVNVTKLEETTRAKLGRFPNTVIHKGYSQQVVREFKDKLDMAYVDGSHTARDVMRDSVLAFDLLKVGGVLIWDDYSWAVMPNELDRPRTGIDAFLKVYLKHVEILQPRGWQVAVRKKSEE